MKFYLVNLFLFCSLLISLNSCRNSLEKKMDRFKEALAGTWEIRSIAYPSPDTVITYGINPPLIIWEDCDFDINVSAYCPGEIRDQEGDLLPVLYQGIFDREDQSKGGIQITGTRVIALPVDYNPPAKSSQFNDSLSLLDQFLFEVRGDSLILTDGSIFGDSVVVRDVEVVAVRRE